MRDNGGYCLPCILFSRRGSVYAQPAGVLVSCPLTNFRKALETLDKHSGKDDHKGAHVKIDAFLKVMTGQQPGIRVQLKDAAKELLAKNRKKLRSIVETIILCGRQNIPLCGHHDSGLDLECNTCENHGNFWALLQFYTAAGDALQDHLASAPRNATYTSSDIQSQVIDILGDHIQRKILLKVKKAQHFTLIADEVAQTKSSLVLYSGM